MKLLPITEAFVALVALGAHFAAADIVIDEMWSTTYDSSKIQELTIPGIKFGDGTALKTSVNVTAADSAKAGAQHDLIGINLQDNKVHQMVDAFGGGITDSVAITLQEFKTKHPKDYDDLLHLMFSQDPTWWTKGGVGINAVRVPLGACDFGVSPYTYDDTEDGSPDMELELFTNKKAPKLWLTLKDIRKINPALKVITAPWSAPGWMKENTDADQPLFGGNLKAGMEEVFAKYLLKAVSAIKKEEGIEIYALSLLNEPQITTLPYPTMKMSIEQSTKVGKLVRQGLDAAGFQSSKLLAYDHNWNSINFLLGVLGADPDIWDAVAWHGYAGEPKNQKVVHDAFPDKDAYFTEKTEITQYFTESYKAMKDNARNLLVGSIRYFSRSVILWNLVLRKDEDGFTTPHLPNVCTNCNAAILLLPESTDARLASGDPSHAKTVAKAGGAVAIAAADKKPAARKRGLSRRSPATNDAAPGASAAAADTKVAPAKADAVDAGDDKTKSYATTTITSSAAALGNTADNAGKDKAQAVAAADVVDAKKTGTDSVYTTDLFKRTSDYSVLSHLSTAVRPTGDSKAYSKRIGVSSTD